jgi:CheY-like chemotaxis protein
VSFRFRVRVRKPILHNGAPDRRRSLLLAGMRTTPVARHTGAMVSQKPLRCVIVDDNREFLETASSVLESGGITVVGAASSIAEALRSVDQLRPGIVLVDVDLGGENGFDLAERLDPQAGSDGPATILISVHGQEDFADLIAESAALGFIPKAALSASAIRGMLSNGQA